MIYTEKMGDVENIYEGTPKEITELLNSKDEKDKQMDLKSIPTKDLVDELIGRPLSYREMCYYRDILNIGMQYQHLNL